MLGVSLACSWVESWAVSFTDGSFVSFILDRWLDQRVRPGILGEVLESDPDRSLRISLRCLTAESAASFTSSSSCSKCSRVYCFWIKWRGVASSLLPPLSIISLSCFAFSPNGLSRGRCFDQIHQTSWCWRIHLAGICVTFISTSLASVLGWQVCRAHLSIDRGILRKSSCHTLESAWRRRWTDDHKMYSRDVFALFLLRKTSLKSLWSFMGIWCF